MSGQDGIPRQFPPSFSVRQEGWASKHYSLSPPNAPTIYAVSLHTGWSGKPDIILHSGPGEDDPPLATSTRDRSAFSRGATATLPPPPPPPPSYATSPEKQQPTTTAAAAVEERIDCHGGGFGMRPVLSFSIEVGDGVTTGATRRETFEWRHSRGVEVGALGGTRGDGWKLVRLAADAAVAAAPAARASDGREVVAVLATGHLRMNKGFRFQFLGTGADGSLGERWAIMAVISGLRCWERERRARQSSGAV